MPLLNTDVTTALRGHNDDCCHADAPLSSGLHIWVLGHVSHSSLTTCSSAQHGRCHLSVHENVFTSGLEFGTAKQPHVSPISLSPMEISARTIFEQHVALQVGDYDPSINTDETAHNKPKMSSLDKDIECGE